MKSRVAALLLVGALGLSLTACGTGSPLSVLGTKTDDEEEYTIEAPESVINLSEEDEILLNGELKDGVYINRYFGYKLSVPEGGTLVRDNDDATESTEILSLRQGYEDGWGGLSFSAEIEGIDGYVNVMIHPLDDDEIGLSEEELVKKDIDEMWEINRIFGDEEGPEFRTAVLAGEEHPISYQVMETERGESLSADFHIPKGDFEYIIFIYLTNAELEDVTKLFEKI